MVPSAFETWDTETIRVRGESSRSKASQVDLARVVDGRDPQRRALLLAEHLPGHDVRVVLEAGDQHLVARAHVPAAVGLGHEVDAPRSSRAGGRSRGSRPRPGSAAPSPAPPRRRRSTSMRELVHAAVDVRVVAARRPRARRRSRPAASGRWRRCRGRRAACRGRSRAGSGTRARTAAHVEGRAGWRSAEGALMPRPPRPTRPPPAGAPAGSALDRARAAARRSILRTQVAREGPGRGGCAPPPRRCRASAGRRGRPGRAGRWSSRACTSRRRPGSRAAASSATSASRESSRFRFICDGVGLLRARRAPPRAR